MVFDQFSHAWQASWLMATEGAEEAYVFFLDPSPIKKTTMAWKKQQNGEVSLSKSFSPKGSHANNKPMTKGRLRFILLALILALIELLSLIRTKKTLRQFQESTGFYQRPTQIWMGVHLITPHHQTIWSRLFHPFHIEFFDSPTTAYGVLQNYTNIPNYTNPYDWFVFCGSDAFVRKKGLVTFLNQLNYTQNEGVFLMANKTGACAIWNWPAMDYVTSCLSRRVSGTSCDGLNSTGIVQGLLEEWSLPDEKDPQQLCRDPSLTLSEWLYPNFFVGFRAEKGHNFGPWASQLAVTDPYAFQRE